MVESRNPILWVIICLFTFGIGSLYWLWKTKDEINSQGATIPPIWWVLAAIIPIIGWLVALFWLFKYSEGFAKFVKKDDSTIITLVMMIIFPIGVYVVQSELNKLAGAPAQ